MEKYEIELVLSSKMNEEITEIMEYCSPGWCGPVDGYSTDEDNDD